MMGGGKDTGIDELRTSLVSVILTFDLSKLTSSMRDNFRQLFPSNRISPAVMIEWVRYTIPTLCPDSAPLLYTLLATQYLQDTSETMESY